MVGRGLAAFMALTIVSSSLLLPKARGNSEGDALYALRRSLTDPDNVLQSWDPNLVNPCTWFHITCNKDNHVTRVDTDSIGLNKMINSTSICFYDEKQNTRILHRINRLGIQDLRKSIGSTVLSSKNLEIILRTSETQICLVIWCLSLGNSNISRFLELYKNNIQGAIPSEIGNLKSLISLDLYNNNISGTIPPSLGNSKTLVFLRLNDNRLHGPIPRTLSGISSLKVVDVSNNDLCGTIPSTGPFEHVPLNNFENNPRLEGPSCRDLQVTIQIARNE